MPSDIAAEYLCEEVLRVGSSRSGPCYRIASSSGRIIDPPFLQLLLWKVGPSRDPQYCRVRSAGEEIRVSLNSVIR